MDKEEKPPPPPPPPTEAARIEKGIWRIECKAVCIMTRVSSEEGGGRGGGGRGGKEWKIGSSTPIGLHRRYEISRGSRASRNVSIIGNLAISFFLHPFFSPPPEREGTSNGNAITVAMLITRKQRNYFARNRWKGSTNMIAMRFTG